MDACDDVQSFPLPGDFHFRFKAAFEGTYGVYSWCMGDV